MSKRNKDDKRIRKEEKAFLKEEKKKKKIVEKNISKLVSDLIPVLDMNVESESIITSYGCMDIFQVSSKDIYSLNEDESNAHIATFVRFLRTYQAPFKFVIMNFPIETNTQQEFLIKQIKKCKNETYEILLKEKLGQLMFLERDKTNKEFFIFIYAENEKQRYEKEHMILRMSNKFLEFKKVSSEKKKKILFKLGNQNTKII
ncbi:MULTISPECIES: hypothetical protein [unclassified Clostridioides]|uniref:hypothetical protein n=1 Tax=unclassified Clostridioides TaxID=2635829 RepID=UPI001D10BAFA|nr:hypothetical protein [Clostridioides sp. ZZV14-6048]MCC0739999.1 hypothetical protein [Clostridioides sp. ZZV14-5902]